MLTWAAVASFKILKGGNGLWLIGGMIGDCYIASTLAIAIFSRCHS